MTRDNNIQEEVSSVYANIYQKSAHRLIPITATIELTYRCNLRCRHCYIDFKDSSEDELDIVEIEEILKQLRDLGTLFITYTGGEIFLRDDIEDILKLTREMGFGMRVFTNGTLITPERIELLTEIKPVSLEMSLYAVDEKTHDSITRLQGSFKKTMWTIEEAKKANLPILIKNTWMKMNYFTYKDWMEKLTIDDDIPIIASSVITPCDDRDFRSTFERLNDEEYNKFLINKLEFLNEHYRVKSYDEITDTNANISGTSTLNCGTGRCSICISPYGEIYPCIQLRLSGGNVREMPIKLIWRNSDIFKYVRKLYEFTISECEGCKDIASCNICVAVPWLSERRLLTLDSWYCYDKEMRKEVRKNEG